MNWQIDILLPTYNGEPFVRTLLDSLVSQTYQNWRLIIRDDNSKDNTAYIIRAYEQKLPQKITILDKNGKNLGVTQNFQQLLSRSTAEYIMLCDQDDVWLPQKIEVTLKKMKMLEASARPDEPLLVHTDAKVVDADLREIAQSLWAYQKSDPNKGSILRRLLLQNTVTGCTVMINKPLRDIALPIPSEVMMHDWWLALLASAFGRMDHLSKPTLLYRQHERNDTGAKQWNPVIALKRLLNYREFLKSLREGKKITLKLEKQSAVFAKQFDAVLRYEDKDMLNVYSHLSDKNYFIRRYYIVKYGFFYTDTVRNIGRLLLA